MLDAWVIEKLKEEVDYKPELRIVIDAPEDKPKEPDTTQERHVIIIDVLCHSTITN